MNKTEMLVCILKSLAIIRPGLVRLHQAIALECTNFSLIRESEWLIEEIDRCFQTVQCPELEQFLIEIRQKIAKNSKV
jgi:hypothetical protein